MRSKDDTLVASLAAALQRGGDNGDTAREDVAIEVVPGACKVPKTIAADVKGMCQNDDINVYSDVPSAFDSDAEVLLLSAGMVCHTDDMPVNEKLVDLDIEADTDDGCEERCADDGPSDMMLKQDSYLPLPVISEEEDTSISPVGTEEGTHVPFWMRRLMQEVSRLVERVDSFERVIIPDIVANFEKQQEQFHAMTNLGYKTRDRSDTCATKPPMTVPQADAVESVDTHGPVSTDVFRQDKSAMLLEIEEVTRAAEARIWVACQDALVAMDGSCKECLAHLTAATAIGANPRSCTAQVDSAIGNDVLAVQPDVASMSTCVTLDATQQAKERCVVDVTGAATVPIPLAGTSDVLYENLNNLPTKPDNVPSKASSSRTDAAKFDVAAELASAGSAVVVSGPLSPAIEPMEVVSARVCGIAASSSTVIGPTTQSSTPGRGTPSSALSRPVVAYARSFSPTPSATPEASANASPSVLTTCRAMDATQTLPQPVATTLLPGVLSGTRAPLVQGSSPAFAPGVAACGGPPIVAASMLSGATPTRAAVTIPSPVPTAINPRHQGTPPGAFVPNVVVRARASSPSAPLPNSACISAGISGFCAYIESPGKGFAKGALVGRVSTRDAPAGCSPATTIRPCSGESRLPCPPQFPVQSGLRSPCVVGAFEPLQDDLDVDGSCARVAVGLSAHHREAPGCGRIGGGVGSGSRTGDGSKGGLPPRTLSSFSGTTASSEECSP